MNASLFRNHSCSLLLLGLLFFPAPAASQLPGGLQLWDLGASQAVALSGILPALSMAALSLTLLRPSLVSLRIGGGGAPVTLETARNFSMQGRAVWPGPFFWRKAQPAKARSGGDKGPPTDSDRNS